MTDLPAPAARRLPKARWLDARMLVGALLVLVSMVAGARVIGAADRTVPVWAVTTDLGPDVALAAGDVVARQVHFDAGAEHYLSAAGPSPVGRTLARPVGRGELLPAAALAPAANPDLRQVSVAVQRAGGLSRGAVVDVYQLPASEARAEAAAQPRTAQLVVQGVSIGRVEETTRAIGAATTREVVLLVRVSDVGKVLDAQARGRVELVQLQHAGTTDVAG